MDDKTSKEKEKKRYVLTELGELEFNKLLAKYDGKNAPIILTFYTPMFFVEQVNPTEMILLLETQILQTQKNSFDRSYTTFVEAITS